MTEREERLRPAPPEEAPALFELILRRIAWMEKRGIRQWDRAVYLAYYPLFYFIERARDGELYGLWGPDGSPRVMAVLLERDSRWPDGGNALYVHNLAADPAVPGAGARLLLQCMELARARGKKYLRLDCGQDNAELNAYYERLGFSYMGPMQEGEYRGNLRQCSLSQEGAPTETGRQKEGLAYG